MDRPLAPILLSLIIGIISSYFLGIETIYIVLFLIVTLITFILNIIKNKSNTVISFLLFFALGLIVTNLNYQNPLNDYIDKRHDYVGVILNANTSSENYSKYIVQIIQVDETIDNGRVLLTINGDKRFSIGDKIMINGILKKPKENTNPKLYNQRLNLLSDYIHSTLNVKDFNINLIHENNNWLYEIKQSFSQYVSGLFQRTLRSNNSKLITSIILGDSSVMEEDELEKYRDLGLAHILAVSGLHIGVIAGFLIFIFSRLGINRNINILITLLIIWSYAYIIGFPSSTVRACIMFTILFYSQMIHEPYDSLNSIFVSMLICLIINPFWLFHIGFQLSYMATISLIVIGDKIILFRDKGNIFKTASSIIAVNIGILPLQAYYFNSFPILGMVSNLFTVPLMSLSLILGFIMIFVNYILSFLTPILGVILDTVLSIQYRIVDMIYSLPLNIVNLYSPEILEIFLYYILIGGVIGIIKFRYFPNRLKKDIVMYLLIFVLIQTISISFDDRIEVEFIDVGQGDSILIKTQGKNFLMDTGGSLTFDVGKYITLPYLKKGGIFNLDGVIITHFDADHCQGLYSIMEDIKIDTIYASYIPEDEELLKNIKSRKISLQLLKKGDYLRLDQNTCIEILWPEEEVKNLSANNKSLVSILKYMDRSILLTGDIEKEVELNIKESIPKVDILKVPHHGSSTSSSLEFLEAVRPDVSVISVGKNNFYSHPNVDVLERLKSIQSTIFRTDENGMIRIVMDRESLNITSFRKERLGFIFILSNNVVFLSVIVAYFLISYTLTNIYIARKEDYHDL